MLRSRHILLPVILCLDAIAPLSAQPLGDEADNLYIPPAITVTDDDGREAKIELEEIRQPEWVAPLPVLFFDNPGGLAHPGSLRAV